MDEMRVKSRSVIYQRDFFAWQQDVLGHKTYGKMQEIIDTTLFGQKTRTVVKSSNGTAKASHVDTPLLTTDGWKTVGTVQVGEYVYSEEGRPIEVTWKSPIFHRDTYRITFDDGAEVIVSGEHEWTTLSLAQRAFVANVDDWRAIWDLGSTVETTAIRDTLRRKDGVANHLIPLTRPVEFPEQDLPLDPYVMGAWLGDGTSNAPYITCEAGVDGHVLDQLAVRGFPTRKLASKYGYAIDSATVPLRTLLKRAGVFRNKHVPESYVRSSVDQRIQLLRGLMDTDGYADKRGAVGFGQSNKLLIDAFVEILTSLGVRYSLTSYEPKHLTTPGARHKRAYTVKFRPWFDPFTPGARKSETFRLSPKAQASRVSGRAVVAVDRIETMPTQCIEVDSFRHLYLLGRDLIPTHNSFSMADIICWWVSVFPVGEALAIISAPSVPQLEKVVFAYLKNNYNVAMKRGLRMPGWIDEQLNWKYTTPAGNGILAFGRKPPDQDAVSTFQGVRSNVGKTFVFFDEAGGMSREMYTAAEAVMTGQDSRFMGIGNPDNTGTMFHDIFKDNQRYAEEYNRFTISSFDLPTLTGERVYPLTPDGDRMEAQMLKALTSKDWVEHKQRVWGEKDARYQSKVLGEFPSEGGNAFFPQTAIDAAFNTVTVKEDADQPIILGVDIARWGQDESVIYSNQGGRVRLVDSWGKTDTYESEQRIHAHAKRLGAAEVRVDASGIGGAVFDHLESLPEFSDKTYLLFGIDGGARPPDPAQHHNSRAYNHDSLRDQMVKGKIDFDYEDRELKEQLETVTFRFTQRGATQITPKDEMHTAMGGSPDRLDAAIYATVNLGFLDGPQPGDVVDYDVDLAAEGMAFYSMGSSFGW